jgi:[protein-PII] uridylyltransferase
MTIIARDAPFVLSKFCGVLSANDANIFDAHVFTRNDGIVIDKFRVIDFVSRTALNDSQTLKIHRELNAVLSGTVDVEHLLARHRMKWRRLTRAGNPDERSAVEFEDHPQYTIIDIFAPDRLGFLYRVTEAMAGLQLNISFAKIATRADGIVDSFYVANHSGDRIDSTEERDKIRARLLKTVSDLAESELVTNP